ncbi:MAG: hypothetical protein F6K18_16465 [Okeania sp. SIO2C2]|nr:hypothetical protein [Okeania sp. SIO2C2]
MYSKGRQQATGNRQQATGNRQQATGNRQQAIEQEKKLKFPVDIHANFYTNDINGHDISWTFKKKCSL